MNTASSISTVAEYPGQSDRRHKSRTPTIFTLLYSGMDSGQMLIADGVVTNLSANGIGIRGNRSVTLGMELALFVDIPGVEEPLCVAQSRVSWVEGRRFGVELGAMKLENMNHLRLFLWDHNSPSNNQDGNN
ncbi:MAG: PilZ domain-containing protein [Nitrospirota bacterium]|nr:PilZ domain-containing protein [Nitrospirota bacterium]